MTQNTTGEFFVLDRQIWEEVPDKTVYSSGYIYMGKGYAGNDVRVFTEKRS